MNNNKPLYKLPYITKLLSSSGSIVYSVVETTILLLILNYGLLVLELSPLMLALVCGLGFLLPALALPYIFSRINNIQSVLFGKYHLVLALSAIVMAIFNVLLWNIPLGCNIFVKAGLMLLYLMIVQLAITCFAHCNISIGKYIVGDAIEARSCKQFRNLFACAGVLLSVLLIALTGDVTAHSTVQIALIVSSIAMLGGLASFFSSVSLLPTIINREPLVHIAKRKRRLLQVYKDFFAPALSHKSSLSLVAYLLSLVAMMLLLVNSFFFMVQVYEHSHIYAMLLIFELCLMIAVGFGLWKRVFKLIKRNKISLINLIVSISCIVFFVALVLIMNIKALYDSYKLVMVFATVILGLALSVNFRASNDLLKGSFHGNKKENTTSEYYIKCFLFYFAMGVSILIVSLVYFIFTVKSSGAQLIWFNWISLIVVAASYLVSTILFYIKEGKAI